MEDFKSCAIEQAIFGFDFNKAASALAGCAWKFDGEEESPSAKQLEVMARKLCAHVIDAGHSTEIKQGPIQVSVYGWHRDEDEAQARAVMTLRLELIPVFSHGVYVDFAHIDHLQTDGGAGTHPIGS